MSNTADHVKRPHAFAIDLLKKELADCSLQVSHAETKARQAAARPARDGAERERTRAAAARWKDLRSRLQESLLVLEDAQRTRAADAEARDAQLPEAAAEAICKFFIKRPESLEILSSDYLGNGHWNVETNVTYAGNDRPEPRPFLLVRTTDYRLLVNP